MMQRVQIIWVEIPPGRKPEEFIAGMARKFHYSTWVAYSVGNLIFVFEIEGEAS